MEKKRSFKINMEKINTLDVKGGEMDLPAPSPRLAQQISAGRRNSLADAMDVLKQMKLKVKERRKDSARQRAESTGSDMSFTNGDEDMTHMGRRSSTEPLSGPKNPARQHAENSSSDIPFVNGDGDATQLSLGHRSSTEPLDDAIKRSKLQPRARAPHPNPSPRSFTSSVSTDLDDDSSDNDQPITDRSKRSTPPRGEYGNGAGSTTLQERLGQSVGAKNVQDAQGLRNGLANGHKGSEEEDDTVVERTVFEAPPRRPEMDGFQQTNVCQPEGEPSTDVLDVAQIKKVAHAVVEDVLGDHPDYQASEATQWMSTITSEGVSRLAKLGSPFKFIVTSFVCERNEQAGVAGIGGVSTASACKWNTTTDGSVTVLWYGASVYCITTVYGIHL